MKVMGLFNSIRMSGINTIGKYKYSQVLVLAILFLIFFILVIAVPLWGNVLLGFGALAQSSVNNGFPELIFEADYIRGFVYKLLLYGIMNITEIFIEKSQFYNYQQVSKVIYYLFCFLISFSFIKVTLKDRTLGEVVKVWFVFWIILFLSGYRQFMEAEELAVVFTLGHFLFIYSSDRRLNYISGVFVFFLFGCKAITLLYAGFGIMYLILFEYQNTQKLKRVFASHIAWPFVVIILYSTLLYPEIVNLKSAMSYQGSGGFEGISTLKKFLVSYIKFLPYLPILIIIPISIILSFQFGKKKEIVFLISAFLLSSFCVIFQNRFSSPYHYLSFTPIVLYSLFKLFVLDSFAPAKKYILFSLLGIGLFVVLNNYVADINLGSKARGYIYTDYFNDQIKIYTDINSILANNQNENLLFLTGDCPPFFINAETYTKKVSAMLLNRSLLRPHLTELEEYKKYYQEVLNYHGRYILVDPDYLNVSMFPELDEKINSNYFIHSIYENTVSEFSEKQLILYQNVENK